MEKVGVIQLRYDTKPQTVYIAFNALKLALIELSMIDEDFDIHQASLEEMNQGIFFVLSSDDRSFDLMDYAKPKNIPSLDGAFSFFDFKKSKKEAD